VFALLLNYPDGLSLQDLADQFGVSPEVMRQDLVTFMDLESWGWLHQIFRPPAVEFVGPEEGDSPATVVRVLHDAPATTLGVEYLSAGDLALIYTAGLALLDVDPDDQHLRDALGVIAETMYGEPGTQPSPGEWNRLLPLLQQAQAERRRVDIVYSRAWRVGVRDRVIEPLQLLQTNRGWEVDAGPPDQHGNLRTYLLSNIRDAELRDETFDPPAGLESRLVRQRRTTTVRMALAQESLWATDMYAEKVTVVSEDEDDFIADLELLPPLGERIALLMLASGEEARLLEPTHLMASASQTILELLAHHEASDV
jgi:proteasome accessory factor C